MKNPILIALVNIASVLGIAAVGAVLVCAWWFQW